jgi:hypothetical protein
LALKRRFAGGQIRGSGDNTSGEAHWAIAI